MRFFLRSEALRKRGRLKEEFSLTRSEYPMMVSEMEGEMEGDGQCFLQHILLHL